MTYRQGEGLPDEPPPSIVETTTEARQGVTGHNVRYCSIGASAERC
jgi:hypothetical protein